jgi:2'-5' RNA ligase
VVPGVAGDEVSSPHDAIASAPTTITTASRLGLPPRNVPVPTIGPNTSFAGVSRHFIAVWPPSTVTDLIAGLPRVEAPRLRWTTPDQWHVTLRFLGDVDEDAAIELFDGITGRRSEAELGPVVQRLGTELVVAPVRGLDALAAAVWAVCPEVGAAPHADGFRGHLTVARQRGGGSTSADGAAIATRFVVDEIALVRSELRPDGACYTTVTRRALPA